MTGSDSTIVVMKSGARFIRKLERLGRPAPVWRWLAAFFRSVDVLLVLLPLAAILWRLERGRDDIGLVTVGKLVLIGLALAAAVAWLRAWLGRGDPVVAARRLDDDLNGAQRFLSSVDATRRSTSSTFLPLLLEDVEERLDAQSTRYRVRPNLRPPHLLRGALLLLLAWLLVVLPGLGRGVIGAPSNRPGGIEPVSGASTSEGDGERGDSGRGGRTLGDVLRVGIVTDRRVYLLGEEINLGVQVDVLEPVPAGVALALDLQVNGEKFLQIPLELEMPAQPGDVATTTVPLKERLEKAELYKRGLLTFDPFVRPRDPHDSNSDLDDLPGAAAGNRLTIQLSENVEKSKAARNQSADRKKIPKRPQPKKDKSSNQSKPKGKSPKKKPRPRPGPGPAPKRPGELDAKPYVMEPLISGDQTKERDARVYDRDIVDGERPPPEPKERRRLPRGYQKRAEVELEKINLAPRERSLVRRYLDSIRPRAEGDGANRRPAERPAPEKK